MPLDPAKIKNICAISLSNIGDVILTLPAVDILRRDFPQAELTLIVGPKAKSLFDKNPNFKDVIIFEKHDPFRDKIKFVQTLRGKKFDCVVDFRNTVIPFFLGARYKTGFIVNRDAQSHMREKHLARLRSLHRFKDTVSEPKSIVSQTLHKQKVDEWLDEVGFQNDKLLVIAPGAAHPQKCWGANNYAQLAELLAGQYNLNLVIVGDQKDVFQAEALTGRLTAPALNLCRKTNLLEVAELMRRSKVVLANDSGLMHLASYLNRPVVAFFGMGEPKRYHPWAGKSLWFSEMQALHPKEVYSHILRSEWIER